jgi:hypothetical protein
LSIGESVPAESVHVVLCDLVGVPRNLLREAQHGNVPIRQTSAAEIRQDGEHGFFRSEVADQALRIDGDAVGRGHFFGSDEGDKPPVPRAQREARLHAGEEIGEERQEVGPRRPAGRRGHDEAHVPPLLAVDLGDPAGRIGLIDRLHKHHCVSSFGTRRRLSTTNCHAWPDPVERAHDFAVSVL